MDLETTFRLKKHIPEEIPVVSESGLKTVEDFRRLRDEGIAAALVGETLMRAGADSALLQSLRGNKGSVTYGKRDTAKNAGKDVRHHPARRCSGRCPLWC